MNKQMKQRIITISFIAFGFFASDTVKAVQNSEAVEAKQDIEQTRSPQEVTKKIVDETNNLIVTTPTGFTFLLKSGIQNIKTLAVRSCQMAMHPLNTAINVSSSIGGRAQEITKSGLKKGYYIVCHPFDLPKRLISIVRHPIKETQNFLTFCDNIDFIDFPIIGRINEVMTQFNGLILITPENCPMLYNMLVEAEQELGVEVNRKYIFKGNFWTNLLESLEIADLSCNAFQTGLTSKTSCVVLGKDLILGVNRGSNSFMPGLSPEQMQAIFAHELGHQKNRHVLKLAITRTVSVALLTFIQYLIFSKLIIPNGSNLLRVHIGGKDMVWTSLNLMVYQLLDKYAIPLLLNAYSRKCEREADMQACCSLDKHAALAEGLSKLIVLCATKHRALSQFFKTHPDLGQRLDYLHQPSTAEATR